MPWKKKNEMLSINQDGWKYHEYLRALFGNSILLVVLNILREAKHLA